MGHAKPDDLTDLPELLAGLRSLAWLKEKSIGCFYRKGKAVLHFHVAGPRRFVHVFNGKKWEEVDVPAGPSPREQLRLCEKILVFLGENGDDSAGSKRALP